MESVLVDHLQQNKQYFVIYIFKEIIKRARFIMSLIFELYKFGKKEVSTLQQGHIFFRNIKSVVNFQDRLLIFYKSENRI